MLLAFKDEALAESLNSALRLHGLDSYVFNEGPGPDGAPMFCINCIKVSDLELARHLIYRSQAFMADLHPEAAGELRDIRRQSHQPFIALITSRRALVFSAVLLAIAALGYLLGL